MNERSNSDVLSTTVTTLRIIQSLQELDGARATELADHLGMASSTVHNHLRTLEQEQYLIKTGDVYTLGPRLLNIGKYVQTREDIFVEMKKVVDELVSKTGEHVEFSVMDHGRVIVLYEEFNQQSTEGYLGRTGSYEFMHRTAAGKAILAYLSDDVVDQTIDQWGLPKATENTITNPNELKKELANTRERGYAINDQESGSGGAIALGFHVEDASGGIYGAITMAVPPYRLSDHEKVSSMFLAEIESLEEKISSQGLHSSFSTYRRRQ